MNDALSDAMRPTFWCWDADSQDEESAAPVSAYHIEDAARKYAERRWSDSDYPDAQNILVRNGAGKTRRFIVAAEETVAFRARHACAECGEALDYEDAECWRAACGEQKRADETEAAAGLAELLDGVGVAK